MTGLYAGRGGENMEAAVASLASRLPDAIRALARLAYNYWWSWAPGGNDLFRSVDETRWARSRNNPVRLLQEVDPPRLEALAGDRQFLARLAALQQLFEGDQARPRTGAPRGGGEVAFFCAEFGIHHSLPFYAGGLGVLAGDLLKEASDRGVPMVGLGLFYSQGSFHQRLDASGWQHEYWLETDSDRLPAVLVTGSDGSPLVVDVPVNNRRVSAHVWRVDVGRVPLYLLDSNHPANAPADRWITARLYVGHRDMRVAQYALLGIGGVRALRAMGITPSMFHLNEGHAALALVELLGEQVRAGTRIDEARERVAAITRFTTHTPVAAGNETFAEDDLRRVLPALPGVAGLEWHETLALGRVHPGDSNEPFGLTPLALRLAGRANGVSRLHGEVSRGMWQDIWPGREPGRVPIAHVTNGVHVPTWMASEMSELVGRHIGGSCRSPSEPGSWDGVLDLPDDDLWEVRRKLRARLGALVRERSVVERLGRGQSVEFAESAAAAWDDEALTIGFARRLATYKRLYLITRDPDRGLRLLHGNQKRPVQLVIAGRAHPLDDEAKRTVHQIFALNNLPNVGGRVVFIEDHDLEVAKLLVQGCDLWVNLPRGEQEASGTSGMKSVLNGGLQLSVLDGWWAEAYREGTGWAIASDASLSWAEQDERDASTFFDLLESEIIPLFYRRNERGIPVEWLRWVKESLASHGQQYSATRMLREYEAARAVSPGAL